jgi:hypothetical protein
MTLHDDQLDTIIREAGGAYHPPPPADLDRLWERIGAARRAPHDAARPPAAARFPWRAPLAIAATAVLSFALGRTTAAPPPAVAVAEAPASADAAVTEVANQLLGQTVVLLSTLPEDPARDANALARQAGDLLQTTRLLLDAPDTQRHPALASVLRDLELVLAQVARLNGRAPTEELDLITDAMREQDLVPRIRTIAAGLQAGD